jgi:4-amino-4-deoxy-L-arabinose transferase-like glycosyltransferase
MKKINYQYIWLLIIISAHLIFSLWLLHDKANGFYCYNMDEIGRSEASYGWLKSYTFAPHILWTPLQFWIAGAFYNLFPDIPILTLLSYLSILFSCGILLVIFLIAKNITPESNNKSNYIGIIVLIFLSSFPLFNYLSISGLAEMIMSFWIILGTYFGLRYKTEDKVSLLYLAAISFNLASATRVAGFFFVVVFVLYCLLVIITLRLKPTKKLFHYFFAALVSSGFIVAWLLFNYLETDNLFSFLYIQSAWFHGTGHSFVMSYWMKAIAYPYHMFALSISISAISFISIFFYKRYHRPLQYYYAFVYAQFFFLIITSLIVGSKPNSEVVVFPYFLLFIPGAIALCCYITKINMKIVGNVVMAGFSIIMALWIFNNFKETINRFHNCFHVDSITVGHVIRDLYYKENVLSAKDNIIIEERIGRSSKEQAKLWDSNGIRFFMPDRVFFDRKRIHELGSGGGIERQYLVLKGNPSLFDNEIQLLQDTLDKKGVKIAIIISETRAGKVSEIMEKAGEVGEYKIFVRKLDFDKTARIKSVILANNNKLMSPRKWLPNIFNGASVEINAQTGDIVCKTSFWRRQSIATVKFQSCIPDNFEVNVDFELNSFPFPSHHWVQTDIALDIEGERYSVGRWRDAAGLDAYWMWGGGVPNTYVATKDTTGRLRARIMGSTLYGDFWDGSKWVNIGSRVVKSGTTFVSLDVLNNTSRKYLNVRFNNFKVVSGEPFFFEW